MRGAFVLASMMFGLAGLCWAMYSGDSGLPVSLDIAGTSFMFGLGWLALGAMGDDE